MTIKKYFFFYNITALLTICLQVGCNNNSNIEYCTDDPCHDVITVRLVATNNFLTGNYSVELLFSDNESINAEFELKLVDENDDTSNIILQVIENESYSTSWFIFNEFEDPLEIHYSGQLLSGDLVKDYEFTEEVTVNVKRDGNLLLSEMISPNYIYYQCDYYNPNCYPRRNKDADIEVIIN